MNENRYAIGLDFGTESGRVMLVHLADGEEAAWSVVPYRNGVMEKQLPDGTPLGADWALQDPRDYLEVLRKGIPAVLRDARINPDQVAGIGVDFTASTILPVFADGTPLCIVPPFNSNPHAWVKLWKHHASQPQADRINDAASGYPTGVLDAYGGKYSCEWLIAKLLQIVDEAPQIYASADRILEAGDWLVWQLTGVEVRSECHAGYKGMWAKATGWAPSEFFRALDRRIENVVSEKLTDTLAPLSSKAGGLTPEMARMTGLKAGTPVAVAVIDAHAAVPACAVAEPGALVMIMGTSVCHMLLGEERRSVEGVAGVVEDGIVPGYWGYEAGQAAVGDLYAWFFRTFSVKPEEITRRAARLRAGETGLIAVDWWNGSRLLANANLSGVIAGATLATEPHEIYRALIEATAFGTLAIIKAFENENIPIKQLVACGGLPLKSPLVMQIVADVTNRRIQLPRSIQASGLGAAMHGAVAAGAYANLKEAAVHMASLQTHEYLPNAAAHGIYAHLYEHYKAIHDYFGRSNTGIMRSLRDLKQKGLLLSQGAAPS
jgi:L-ribulokinase